MTCRHRSFFMEAAAVKTGLSIYIYIYIQTLHHFPIRNSDETLSNVYFQETMEDMSAFFFPPRKKHPLYLKPVVRLYF